MSRVVTAILIVCADRCQVLRCLLATLTVCSLTSVFFPLVSLTPLTLNYEVQHAFCIRVFYERGHSLRPGHG